MASIVTPDTLLTWYRKLIARKYDGSQQRGPGRPPVREQIRNETVSSLTIYWAPSAPPYIEPAVTLGVIDDYFNHGYALVDLGMSEVTYYQIPSWGIGDSRKKLPPNQNKVLKTEKLTGYTMNLLNHVPEGMKRGHTGRWDGWLGTWFNLNKLNPLYVLTFDGAGQFIHHF